MALDCCPDMKRYSSLECEVHESEFDCADVLVTTLPSHGPGIIVHDGGSSVILIQYCPWCGTHLQRPEALMP